MIINHLNNSTIWYHSTPNKNVGSILKYGLLINSIPTYQDIPEPWIYVATSPFYMEDVEKSYFEINPGFTIFEVDLIDIPDNEAGWPFGQDEGPIEDRWQLRILTNIHFDKLKMYYKSNNK